MQLPNSLLVSVQKAGAATYAAEQQIKKILAEYSEFVKATVDSHSSDPSADVIFQNWRLITRLSDAMSAIEADLRTVHTMTAQLVQAETPILDAKSPVVQTLSLPFSPKGASDITDVKVKKEPQKPKRVKPAVKLDKPLSPNAIKLMEVLLPMLNAESPIALKQKEIGVKAGVPSGSVAASFRLLVSKNLIQLDASGNYSRGSAPYPV